MSPKKPTKKKPKPNVPRRPASDPPRPKFLGEMVVKGAR